MLSRVLCLLAIIILLGLQMIFEAKYSEVNSYFDV